MGDGDGLSVNNDVEIEVRDAVIEVRLALSVVAVAKVELSSISKPKKIPQWTEQIIGFFVMIYGARLAMDFE